MRRALMTMTLGSLLLTGAACDGDAQPTATGATTAAPSPAPTISTPDYSANTRLICADVQKVFDTDIEPFGAALGKMIAFKEEKLTKEAEKVEKVARKQLRTVAAKLVKATKDAEDVTVVIAGKTSADKFAASAADDKLYDKLKNSKDLNRFIDSRMGDWLAPISGYCARTVTPSGEVE